MKKKHIMYPIHNVHVDYVLKGQYFGHGLNEMDYENEFCLLLFNSFMRLLGDLKL